METSILIAQILAVAYLTIGLGFLINPKYFKKMMDEIMENAGFMFFGGIMSLVAGFLIVNVHNVWVKDWTVIVTIFGWLALAKGVLIFLVPKLLLDFSKKMFKKVPMQGIGFGAVILGAVLGYFGFMA